MIFTAMPKGRFVTANDILNRMDAVPPGVGPHDITNNIRHMVDGVAIEAEMAGPRGPMIYRRLQ